MNKCTQQRKRTVEGDPETTQRRREHGLERGPVRKGRRMAGRSCTQAGVEANQGHHDMAESHASCDAS